MNNERMKKLAKGKEYEDEIEEAVMTCKQELKEISDLYGRLIGLES